MNTSITLDGFGPLPTARPGCVEELGEVVRQAAATDAALYPLGGQTHAALGMAPTKQGQVVDMRSLDRIVDFAARDMTVTVQAGITLERLRETLARENLRLPIDVAQADRATLGGVLSANVSGPRRFGYGTLRDYVIGISAVNDEGCDFKAGGRVVKNVAGYDLCKLLIGSLGTLGIITQATLKLRPIAELQAIVCLHCASAQLGSMLASLHESATQPVIVDLLNPAAAQRVFSNARLAVPESEWTVLAGYEGNADAVCWQVQQLAGEACTRCRLQVRIDYTGQPLLDSLVDSAAWIAGELVFKANLLPSAVADFCLAIDRERHRPALRCQAGNGIVYGSWPTGLPLADADRMLRQWRELARKGQGSVIVVSCPPEWKPTLNVWGPIDTVLMREVKAKFDPRRIFNPGRFLDGI
jgi:glycolate oxidase FAD binding subunit